MQPHPRTSVSDSHVHLDQYADAEVDAILRASKRAGLQRILAVSSDLASAERTLALCHRSSLLRAGLGLHPLRVDAGYVTAITALERLAADPLARAVSEVGLDFSHGAPAAELQVAAFRAALRLARRAALPVFVHSVAADDELLMLLAMEGHRLPVVLHYFTGSPERAERLLKAGCYISFGRPVTRAQERGVRTAARITPLHRLLVETDSYPLPGRTTQPADVISVIEAIAELKQLPVAEVAATTSATLARLLGDT